MSNAARPAALLAAAPSKGSAGPMAVSVRDRRLKELVDRHLDLATRMVRNVGAPDGLVEDIVQQAFQICAARIADIELGKERAFLIQTALRLVTYTRRVRAQAREVVTDELPDVADERLSPEEISDRGRAAQRLDEILSAMDLDQRAVFLLYEVEQLTMAEIAATLSIPQGTVASRLRRARADFLARVPGAGFADRDTGGCRG